MTPLKENIMPWIESFKLFMKSNISALQEMVMDPEKMVHQLIIDMDEELIRVRRSVGNAIADEILLRKKVEKAREDAELWANRAESAIKRDNETSAKTALERKIMAEERMDTLDSEYKKQKAQTAKLQRSIADLEDKIRQARQKQTLLLARLARADSNQRINSALNQSSGHSAFAHFKALEDRVDRAEAMSEAYDRLDGIDPDAAELEQQFEEDERRSKLTKEYDALKQRLSKNDQEA